MKKYLPFILLGLGFLVVMGAIVGIKVLKKAVVGDDEGEKTRMVELTDEQKPIVYLTPSPDGHYLKLRVENMGFGAASMDYLLLYNTKDIQQGVPGSFNIEGQSSYEADLLLGSESSGKFRYDEGVEIGQIDIRYNDSEGNLMLDFSLPFHLQTGVSELTSADGDYAFELEEVPEGKYFVLMQAYGKPISGDDVLYQDSYMIISSDAYVSRGN